MKGSIRFGDWVWNPDTLELRNDTYMATLEPRVARLFEFMLEHQGELLSHDRLVEAVWDGRVISIEAVRHAVFSLRQALAAGGSDNCIRTVHKKGYIATLPMPQATQQASHSDGLTAPEISATPAATVPSSTPPVSAPMRIGHFRGMSGRLVVLGIIAVAVLFGLFLIEFGTLRERESASSQAAPRPTLPATIAVLPFTNVSEQDTGQFLADGLTDELLTTLERNNALRVTARSSAFQFAGQQMDARELGRRLGVSFLLEGSVSGSASELQVRPRLVDTQSGEELWAATYESSLPNWFSLQQEAAEAVAGAVQSRLNAHTQAITLPPRVGSEEAQLELLRARQLLITRSVADAEQAIEHLQRALTLDPNYALAYARLADAILIQAESTTGINAARPAVTPLLEKALALDPGLGEAYALRSRLTDDRAAAERDLRRGLELNPSYARGYEMLADLQFAEPQQMDLANDSIDTAIALDPLTPANLHTKATFMMMRGNYPEAIILDSRALELNPDFRAALAQLGFMSGVEGNFANAVYYAERALALDPRTVQLREMLILAYLAVGELDSIRVLNDPPTPYGQLALGESEGDMTQAADDLYSGRFSALGIMRPEAVSQIILHQALADRDFARALALLSTVLPIADGLPPNTIAWTLVAYANLKQLLDANGKTDEASRLQEQMEVLMGSLEARFPRHALVHNQVRSILLAHAGREEDACATLESAYSPVPRLLWWAILGNPAFNNMRSAPCFVTLRARIDAHVAVEREAIEVMRREGKIPDRVGTQRKREDATPL
jgi:TolB-like protein/DNA-binding winged helix-turn-helix (wHTH) protein/Tfp pilus assembly protein PilF